MLTEEGRLPKEFSSVHVTEKRNSRKIILPSSSPGSIAQRKKPEMKPLPTSPCEAVRTIPLPGIEPTSLAWKAKGKELYNHCMLDLPGWLRFLILYILCMSIVIIIIWSAKIKKTKKVLLVLGIALTPLWLPALSYLITLFVTLISLGLR